MSGASFVNPLTGRKLVFVLADGLRADTARDYMGYLQALREAGRAQWSNLRCELPSLSRPLYATVLTGQRPLEHGVVGNMPAGRYCGDNLIEQLAAHGGKTAMAAYHWFYELLSGEVFDPLLHRHALTSNLSGAAWYYEDEYPDSHLLADAEYLRRTLSPELLFIHPMGPDHAGHTHGGESAAYAMAARRLDMQLAQLVPRWHQAGYDVLLTSDHGMNVDRMHGGALSCEREVPLVWAPHTSPADASSEELPIDQLGLRAFVLSQLCRV